YFSESAPFYSIFDVGEYTFAPYKVVWPNIASELACVVVSGHEGKTVVPQHIITLVATENAEEAHFVCALLNSAPVNFTVQSYSQKGGKSFGTPHVLENVRIPRYDPANSTHRRLAALSQQAHQATATGETARVRGIEAEIDRLAAKLWGLTETELQEIQDSLKELR
ncbi:MAG: SAM-dependent DNA methyltransferase, partial [Deltaproteobacteria bacterium]|nr:SAM-dependent DNA methyltransferase [Deltaproteobacteria bacterium]